MIKAIFKECENHTEAVGLYQWDYGQTLEIWGLEDLETAEVHFAAKYCDKAIIQVAEIGGNGVIRVDIPDKLLETGKDIDAYVYIATPDEGETIRTISLPVKSRPKPDDYDSPSKKNLLRQLMEKVEGKADNAKVIDGCLQLLSGEKEIGDRIRLPAGGSESGGREIELRNNGAAIQWRYTDSNEWTDLIQITELKGADGETPEFEIREGHLYAIYKN